jgi:FtsP/CotA-like multicopper oxidase with cupredoxin domain
MQWYLADSTGTEVALNPAELAAAQIDPNISPTPDTTISPAGPNWIQIGTEGGFLPAPVVVPNQPITWIIDPTRFDVGNVDKHSLLLAPAERADVIVDFSKFAGKTLILYNDAPAAFPARVSSYDYYTGAPDLSPVGAPTILPGYGPNTRTIMQVKIAAATPASAFNLSKLNSAFLHKANGSGVFESGQHPIIVGQAAYNSAYGTSFAASSYCNGGNTSQICDGMARIGDQGGTLFGFNTLFAPTQKLQIPLEPKAIHDEMNSAAFDEFGRMTANMGLEAVPATPAGQNIILYPYVNPPTEIIDGTNLPKNDIVNMMPISPIASADGTQIWKITHNGVDTHPIHFHLFDVQLLNRVTWDNIIIPTEASELGWKDTIRVSPLEDTIVALRPIVPDLPFELPNSVRPLHPGMPLGMTLGFNNIDPSGNPTTPIANQLINFGWEYVWHCHILSHEEMDMMRPVAVALPPAIPTGLSYETSGTGTSSRLTLSWEDTSIIETSFLIQRDAGAGYVNLGTVLSPLDVVNTKGTRTYLDTTYRNTMTYKYRVVAQNTVGYGAGFPSTTATSVSSELIIGTTVPTAPSGLTATLQSGPQIRLVWIDNASNETGFIVQRSTDGGFVYTQIGGILAANSVTFTDTSASLGVTYTYRVGATNAIGTSSSNTVQVIVPAAPGKPSITSISAVRGTAPNSEKVTAVWGRISGAISYRLQWSTTNWGTVSGASPLLGSATTTYRTGNITRRIWYFRVGAINSMGTTWSDTVSVATP